MLFDKLQQQLMDDSDETLANICLSTGEAICLDAGELMLVSLGNGEVLWSKLKNTEVTGGERRVEMKTRQILQQRRISFDTLAPTTATRLQCGPPPLSCISI
jgi:hypothetical protein